MKASLAISRLESSTTKDTSAIRGDYYLLTVALLLIIVLIPIAVTPVPPLVDYPNHLARFHIIAELNHDTVLSRFYALDWRILPNLAGDLIVPPLGRLVGIEAAGRLFLAATVFLLATGPAVIAYVLTGSYQLLPLTAFLFVYNTQFLWGFANFEFSIGLALWAFAAMLALRRRSLTVSVIAAAALSLATFVSHLYGCAVFLVLLGSWHLNEAVLRRNEPDARGHLLRGAAILAAAAAVPATLMLFSPTGDQIGATRFNTITNKLIGLIDAVHGYVLRLDLVALLLFLGAILYGLRRGTLRLIPGMAVAVAALLLLYLALPEELLGSFNADRRIIPVVFLLASCSFAGGFPRGRTTLLLGLALAGVFLVRVGVVTEAWARAQPVYAEYLAAFEQLSPGSRLATIAPVESALRRPPLLHIGSYAVTWRDAFANGLFADPSSQPLRLVHRPRDLLQGVPDQETDNPWPSLDLCELDFVLLVEPEHVALERPPGILRITKGGSFELFRVEPLAAGCPQRLN
jgi:hypothetical protein